jgi:hypothetical protein
VEIAPTDCDAREHTPPGNIVEVGLRVRRRQTCCRHVVTCICESRLINRSVYDALPVATNCTEEYFDVEVTGYGKEVQCIGE